MFPLENVLVLGFVFFIFFRIRNTKHYYTCLLIVLPLYSAYIHANCVHTMVGLWGVLYFDIIYLIFGNTTINYTDNESLKFEIFNRNS